MKKVRFIASTLVLALAGFATLTMSSCTKDDEECLVGYEGSDCKTEVRTKYNNTYRGTGSNSIGQTYTNWALRFSTLGTDATKMRLEVLDNANANQLLFNVTLTSNTTYTIDPKTDGFFSYEGQGSISTTNSSLTLTERDNTTGSVVTTIYTFNNMVKE